jgi:hypothetical protein
MYREIQTLFILTFFFVFSQAIMISIVFSSVHLCFTYKNVERSTHLKMVQKRIAISMGIEEIIANKQRANV